MRVVKGARIHSHPASDGCCGVDHVTEVNEAVRLYADKGSERAIAQSSILQSPAY